MKLALTLAIILTLTSGLVDCFRIDYGKKQRGASGFKQTSY